MGGDDWQQRPLQLCLTQGSRCVPQQFGVNSFAEGDSEFELIGGPCCIGEGNSAWRFARLSPRSPLCASAPSTAVCRLSPRQYVVRFGCQACAAKVPCQRGEGHTLSDNSLCPSCGWHSHSHLLTVWMYMPHAGSIRQQHGVCSRGGTSAE